VTVQQAATVVSVTPVLATLTAVGQTALLEATAADRNGHAVESGFLWSSSAQSVASVDGNGVVTAAGEGMAVITARVGAVSGSATVVVDLPQPVVTMVTAGSDHTCAITDRGEAYCWGANTSGQLGDGTRTRRLVPTRVAGALRFLSISAGYGHTCASATNSGYCWGRSDRGQVGDGALGERLTPMAVAGGRVFRTINAGRLHTCGVTVADQAFCWGWGGNGELGNGTTTDRSVPDSVRRGGRYSALGGSAHTHCAVLVTSGAVDCWGRNNTGQVGDGTVTCASLSAGCFGERSLPTRVLSSASFVQVTSGARIINGFGGGTSCGVTSTREAWCWGTNESGQIGDDTQAQRTVPALVSGGHAWSGIDLGSNTTCAVTTIGAGYCWGFNGAGVVGDGTSLSRRVPTPVAGGLSFSHISVGFDHACGVTTGGDVYCWGANGSGQLGTGFTASSAVPVRVSFPF
jgi:alpha-tubulin suppressor-like RCC1 family protein